MRFASIGALALVLIAAPAHAASGLTTRDYWGYADQIAAAFDGTWDQAKGEYAWQGVPEIRTNANLLLAHSVAAYLHHRGAARQDARARVLVSRLTTPPVWRGTAHAHPALGMSHTSTCWATDLNGTWPGHMSLEPKVAAALAWAFRARHQLGLPAASVAAIRRDVSACAHSAAWRYPAVMANQINWYAEMYASAATVTGSGSLLRSDYRAQLARFAAGIRRPMRGKRSANLGANYEFHYRPDMPATAAINIEAPEYADIVIDAISHYDRALRLGMRPLPAAAMRPMRAWVTRVLAGNWTHAGYLNWDTGHGFGRWHSAQYWAFAQQGLLAIASSRRYWSDPRYGRWAKALFDNGLGLYHDFLSESGRGLETDLLFGIEPMFQDADVFHSRMLSNIARAIALGLGRAPSQTPPPLYAFDADTGRLAISTPSYSTAIVPNNRGAFPYGGIELARLFAAGQRVAANVGGLPPAAFGVVVHSAGGATVSSQESLPTASGHLRLTRSPRGPVTHPKPYPARPYAGPFDTITAVGSVRKGAFHIRTTHTFAEQSINEHWHVDGPAGYKAEAHFPTWGGSDAFIEVELKNGSVVRIGGSGADRLHPLLGEVRRITLDTGSGSGYSVVPMQGSDAARLSVVPAARQTSDPNPGPTLAIEMSRDLTVKLIPFVR